MVPALVKKTVSDNGAQWNYKESKMESGLPDLFDFINNLTVSKSMQKNSYAQANIFL